MEGIGIWFVGCVVLVWGRSLNTSTSIGGLQKCTEANGPGRLPVFLKTFNGKGNLINPDSVIFEQNTIDMQTESKLPLKGINYLMDSDNNKVAVQIDLEMYGELWQEFLDRLIIEFRKDEESDSFDDFLKELEEEGLLDE